MYCGNCLLHNITGILYIQWREKKIKSSIDQILKIQRRSFHFEFLARRRKKKQLSRQKRNIYITANVVGNEKTFA